MSYEQYVADIQSFFYLCTLNNIPVIARDGFVLGVVRHSGFMVYDPDPDLMIHEESIELLDNVCSISNGLFNIKPYQDDTMLLYRNDIYIVSIVILYDIEDNKIQQGKRLWKPSGVDPDIYPDENELFYEVYGHNKKENNIYTFNRSTIYPTTEASFYGKPVTLPGKPIEYLKYHYGDNVLTHYFDKRKYHQNKNYAPKLITNPDDIKLHIDENKCQDIFNNNIQVAINNNS